MSDTVSLTLRRRKMALTLPGRRTNPGLAGNTQYLHRCLILQGFHNILDFDKRAFLLYGLTGDVYDATTAPSPLTLRRRKMALTLGG